MSIMRVEKSSNYTVMANYHLRDKRLTLKAKGLLSVMLSLPAEWDYTLAGLAYISKEGVSAIRAAIQELEENGYVSRSRVRNEAGQLGDIEYTIYESPQVDVHEAHQTPSAPASVKEASGEDAVSEPICDFPTLDKPVLDNPTLDKPTLDSPMLVNPTLENPTQINKDRLNPYPEKKEKIIPDTSNPYPSNIHPSIPETGVTTGITSVATLPESSPIASTEIVTDIPVADKPSVVPVNLNTNALSAQQKYLSEPSVFPNMRRRLTYNELVKKVKDQIDYLDLIENEQKDEIDNILSIMVEVMSTKCEYFTISGRQYPADLVHERYSQINFHTIGYVLECLHRCGSDIRNIKQYLIATLFNAPATYGSYYDAAVRRDFEFLRGR